MPSNQLTLLRQWTMLRLVPRAPSKIDVKTLKSQLEEADFEIGMRTIQRDLVELSTLFPLVCDEREKPYGWSWERGAPSFDLPGLSIPDALTLTLVEQHLRNQLPPSTLDALQPQFKSAARTLSALDAAAMSKAWLGKVRSIAPLQPLKPPVMDEESQRIVYSALMKDLQLRLHYKKRDETEATLYSVVHPLAVVQRGGIIYLVCTFASHDDVRTLALHRIREAHLIYENVRRQPGFDIDAFIASGAFGFRTGPPVTLRARFQRPVAEHLFETPLAADQRLEPEPDGSVLVSATVAATRTLVYWLTGFGGAVEVLDPPELRAEMTEIARKFAATYLEDH